VTVSKCRSVFVLCPVWTLHCYWAIQSRDRQFWNKHLLTTNDWWNLDCCLIIDRCMYSKYWQTMFYYQPVCNTAAFMHIYHIHNRLIQSSPNQLWLRIPEPQRSSVLYSKQHGLAFWQPRLRVHFRHSLCHRSRLTRTVKHLHWSIHNTIKTPICSTLFLSIKQYEISVLYWKDYNTYLHVGRQRRW